MFPNQDLRIHVSAANFKTKLRVAVLYAKPGSSDDDITDAIDESFESKNRVYETVLTGDFNIDMGTTTRARTSIDALFSTHSVRTCGLYDSIFCHHLPLYVQIPQEKTRLRTVDPPEDDDPRLECGPDPWNFAARIDLEFDDDDHWISDVDEGHQWHPQVHRGQRPRVGEPGHPEPEEGAELGRRQVPVHRAQQHRGETHRKRAGGHR
ncbi:ATP-dependent DNA helicase [Caerostris darwini]|uniref:ATP-dependent DNA helicase n=1 Tax=Caerostris darwini TaxID=1538125 RepID=A0AAV4WGQ7_9ARAC|nr:ATP-dependent DNA helicase [Caerostris darwini]